MKLFEKLWRGQQGATGRQCAGCGTKVLTTSEFYDALEAKGLKVDRATGGVKVSGVVSGPARGDLLGGLQGEAQRIYSSIEDSRGYQCQKCGRPYCTSCLMKAPQHATTGGRACPRCGGEFGLLE